MGVTWEELMLIAMKFLPNLIAAMVILAVGVWAAAWLGKLVQRLLERRQTDTSLIALFSQATRWGTIGLAATMALQQVGFNITAFLTGVGILGFTVGFALQDVSKNLMAGILLLLQQPFSLGEAIQVNDFAGTEEEISLRATRIRTFDGRVVYLPNADVYTSAIINFSRADKRRLEVQVGVAYGTDLAHAKAVALEAIQNVPGFQSDPAPVATFHTFNDSSVDMSLYF
jgi:small conductance mechanosensitive channel